MGLALLQPSSLVKFLGVLVGAIQIPFGMWDEMKRAHERLILTQGKEEKKNSHVDNLVTCHRFLSGAYSTLPERR